MFPRGGEFHAIILFLNSNDCAHARMQVPRALAHLWEIMVDLERPHEEALKRFCFSSLDYYDTRHFRQGVTHTVLSPTRKNIFRIYNLGTPRKLNNTKWNNSIFHIVDTQGD